MQISEIFQVCERPAVCVRKTLSRKSSKKGPSGRELASVCPPSRWNGPAALIKSISSQVEALASWRRMPLGIPVQAHEASADSR